MSYEYNTFGLDSQAMSITCTLRDERYASLALIEAQNSNMKYHQHGCIAVVDGSIIARGWNSYGSHPNDKYLSNTCSCHAEIDVMRKIERLIIKKRLHTSNRNIRNNFLGRTNIYVVRSDRGGDKYKDSAPCARCTKFMKSLNIKNIIYSNEYGTLTKCRVRDYETTYNSHGAQFLEREEEEHQPHQQHKHQQQHPDYRYKLSVNIQVSSQQARHHHS